jgi:hypothetical protein
MSKFDNEIISQWEDLRIYIGIMQDKFVSRGYK